jgi:hypothetical protein
VFAVFVMFGVLALIYKGKLVPGFVYQREVDRGDKATATAEKAVDGLTTVATNQDALTKLFEGFVAGKRGAS